MLGTVWVRAVRIVEAVREPPLQLRSQWLCCMTNGRRGVIISCVYFAIIRLQLECGFEIGDLYVRIYDGSLNEWGWDDSLPMESGLG